MSFELIRESNKKKKNYLKKQAIELNNPSNDFSELEAACNSSHCKIVEFNKDPVQVILIGTHINSTNQHKPIANFLKKTMSENDSVLFQHIYKARIHQGYENIEGFISLIPKELKEKNIYLIANHDPSISIDMYNIMNELRDIEKEQGEESEKASQLSLELIEQHKLREQEILYEKWGIFDQLKLSNRVYQVMDAVYIASGKLQESLERKGIGYCVIIPKEDNNVNK